MICNDAIDIDAHLDMAGMVNGYTVITCETAGLLRSFR